MASRSTAVVPWTPSPARAMRAGDQSARATGEQQKGGGCANRSSGGSRKRWWLVASSVLLAVAAAVTGTVWFGFAAVLPLLFLLPCLAMTAMCLKGMNRNKSAGAGEA